MTSDDAMFDLIIQVRHGGGGLLLKEMKKKINNWFTQLKMNMDIIIL
jgi:hypothetical protein